MAKGQAEILGITIVVALVIMGLLFLLRFSSSGDAGLFKERVSRSHIANNVLSAMLKTSDILCDSIKKPKIEELLIDCAENYDSSGSVLCQPPVQSCSYVKTLIDKKILQETIKKWKMGYEFFVSHGGKQLFTLKMSPAGTETGCPATSEIDSQTYLLPTTTFMLEVKLNICT